jgi:phenylacetate-CoA ligase
MPAVRERIEAAWGARCFDHAGATEVGSVAYPCAADGGLHLFEDEFVCEILDPATGDPVAEGATGELVTTALGRRGFPVIRYRTGDMVARSSAPCSAGHAGMWLPHGILGRVDDMVVIRGMNVFPSAIEEILRRTRGAGEFAITFYNDVNAMDEVKVEVELAHAREAREIQERLRQSLGLRVRIVPVKPGILPTYTGKARRVHDLRPVAAGGR